MKYILLIMTFCLFSCGNKETMLLPKSNVTLVKTVSDHSPIYLFFRKTNADTITEVNRKNSIISTNWIFNIDKRLPLRIIIPEIMKLQQKKRAEKAHKNELAQNYYSYADSIGKNLAFLPFTKVYYKLEKANSKSVLYFGKHHQIWMNKTVIKKEELQGYLKDLNASEVNQIKIGFDQNLSFDEYMQYKIFIESLKINENPEEYIY
jgi:hypothetical protein